MANFVKDIARQYPLSAVIRVAYDDLVSGEALAIAEIPGNAVITGGEVYVQTAFDSATSDAFDLSDGTVTYLSAVNAQATGRTAFTLTSAAQVSVPTDISLTLTSVGGPATAGELLIRFEYVVEGKQNENQ